MIAGLLLFAQIAVTVTAPDTVALDGTAELSVRVAASGPTAATLLPPAFPSFVLVRTA